MQFTIPNKAWARIGQELDFQDDELEALTGDESFPEELVALFIGDRQVTDKELQEWCEKRGLDATEMRDLVYKIAGIFVSEFLTSGYSFEQQLNLEDVDPGELEMGIEVEYEHTSNPIVSRKIALDHLAEIPDYYTRLAKLEETAKKEEG